MHRILNIALFSLITLNGLGQSDSLHLPFAIAGEKKLDEEELKDKKEGFYVTGIPYISSDPLNGFGLGAETQLFFNGKKSDPFFAYTPFRAEVDLTFFYTTRQEREIKMETEVPYIFNTKWRFHGELGYEVDPNQLYFGLGERSLNGLGYATYDAYNNSLSGNKAYFNTYQKKESILNFILHRSFWNGKMRFFFGFEYAKGVYTTPLNNNSFLNEDFLLHNITGTGTNLIPMLQPGILYDSRDLETDPNRGIFAEVMYEISPAILGSSLNFTKLLVHYNFYHKVLPKKIKRLVFATRMGINIVQGNAPFFEYTDGESSEQSIVMLGGPVTLRGYVQNRFTGAVMDFANVEMRYRFMQTSIWKQNLSFSGVPFVDAGGVWDKVSRMNNWQNYRFCEGLGLRIGWNENTTLRFDYAFSPEGQQFFFQLGQTF